jgi:type IV secretory pathway VirB4 component
MTTDYYFNFGRQEDYFQLKPVIRDINTRYQHAYILGGTGTGKTNLMLQMALYDSNHGAVIFVDPKGTAVKALNYLLPAQRIINIGLDNPLCINPLRKDGYHEQDLLNEFIHIFTLLIELTTTNPQAFSILMNEIFREAIKHFKPEQRNLDYLYEFLFSEDKRLDHFKKSPPIYWQEFDRRDPKTRWLIHKEKHESAQRIASRIHLFISDERIKRIVCGKNELSISDIARQGKIVLVDLSRMSKEARIYIGSLISHAVKSYCEYEKQPEYHPLFFYADEFAEYFSPMFSHLLATARDYRAGFTFAHQNFSQMDDNMISSIHGNCRTYVTFNCGPDEARKMGSIYGIEPSELQSLPNYRAWVRILIENTKITTRPPGYIIPPDFKIPIKQSPPPEPKAVNFLRAGAFPV